jgi:hypothetical protein
MKKLILIFSLIALCGVVKAQNNVEVITVPKVVTNTFDQAYPTIIHVTWAQEGNNYVASYTANNEDMIIVYDPTGRLIEQGQVMEEAALPTAAQTYIKETYKNDQVTKVYKIKDANGKTLWKGKIKDRYVMFDENGNVIRGKEYD